MKGGRGPQDAQDRRGGENAHARHRRRSVPWDSYPLARTPPARRARPSNPIAHGSNWQAKSLVVLLIQARGGASGKSYEKKGKARASPAAGSVRDMNRDGGHR